MRKLASVQTIITVTPIPDADNIEVVRVLGWNCVTKKGEFQIGDRCVYVEVDAVLPKTNPEFFFLEKAHYRIQTVKLRGVVSQGIAFSLNILPTGLFDVGDDVTDVLGIVQYIPKGSMGDIIGAGEFPSFISKTDETRVQSLGELLKKNVGLKCDYTEKIDGTSATYFVKDGVFGVCSRNQQLTHSEGAYWDMATKYDIEKKLKSYGRNIAIQGEIAGPGVQGNKYQFAEKRLFVFNVIEIDSREYYNNMKVAEFCIGNEFLSVPILGLYTITDDVDRVVEMSDGFSVFNNKIPREGIVIRAIEDYNDPIDGRISFKAINPKFELKFKGD